MIFQTVINMIKKEYVTVLIIVSILILVLLSVGRTINYFFFLDDYATLGLVQQHQSWGWPYLYLTLFYTPLYALFKTNPIGYFSLGIFTYFLAGVSVYFLTNALTRNRAISWLSSLIFATGYIAIDQFTQTAVTTVNNLNNILVCFVLINFINWIDKRKPLYYVIAFVLFALSVSFIPFRAYPLILFLPTTYLFLKFNMFNLC